MDLSPLFCHIGYGVLVPWPGIETVPPAVGTQRLNRWTTREVPGSEPLIPCCITVLSSWGLTNHHIELWFYSLLSITQKIQIIFFTKASPDESVFQTRYFYLLCQIVGVESSPHIWEVSCVGVQVTSDSTYISASDSDLSESPSPWTSTFLYIIAIPLKYFDTYTCTHIHILRIKKEEGKLVHKVNVLSHIKKKTDTSEQVQITCFWSQS